MCQGLLPPTASLMRVVRAPVALARALGALPRAAVGEGVTGALLASSLGAVTLLSPLPLSPPPPPPVCVPPQLVHQDASKAHLTAEWVMPVLPDLQLWPNTYTTVMFDKDPAEDEAVRGSEVGEEVRTEGWPSEPLGVTSGALIPCLVSRLVLVLGFPRGFGCGGGSRRRCGGWEPGTGGGDVSWIREGLGVEV